MRGDYFILNSQLTPTGKWDEEQAQGVIVYEVVRTLQGIPLFFEDHYQRLLHSCELIGKKINMNEEFLFQQFIDLGKHNNINEGNITLKLIFNGDCYTQALYFIPHSYPSTEDYCTGVKVGFLDVERKNPEAKVEQGMKQKVKASAQEPDVYEVMLVDNDGLITEGSRSNMVFVKEGSLYTCPLNKVLKGITLLKVLEIASEEKIPTIFEAVPQKDIASFDALFITGTSPRILPVASAGTTTFDVQNPVMRRLMEIYNQRIEEDINTMKKKLM
ncbi:MAG TPA: aminotransferase class IV [Prolixibacteraceae bacterium]|nr:aminotransferase class IV [Prolixibacteraceae bacterium]